VRKPGGFFYGRRTFSAGFGLTIKPQKMPSLRDLLIDAEWDRDMWEDAQDYAAHAVNFQDVPSTRCWDFELALAKDFFPEPVNGGRQ
jgi:hypothetical protein